MHHLCRTGEGPVGKAPVAALTAEPVSDRKESTLDATEEPLADVGMQACLW